MLQLPGVKCSTIERCGTATGLPLTVMLRSKSPSTGEPLRLVDSQMLSACPLGSGSGLAKVLFSSSHGERAADTVMYTSVVGAVDRRTVYPSSARRTPPSDIAPPSVTVEKPSVEPPASSITTRPALAVATL